MDIEEIAAIAESVGVLFSVVAIGISIWSIYYSKRLHSDTTKSAVLEKQYDGFNELTLLRVEHHTLNHLFEVPENYHSTLEMVTKALGELSPRAKAETMLKERAVAMYIFQLFEYTYYQYQHAKETEDQYREAFLLEVLNYFTGRLLRNPRLVYYWNKDGGNLCVFFEESTQEYYVKHVTDSGNSDDDHMMDRCGPFVEAEQ